MAGCSTAADCDSGSAAYDADNYTCTAEATCEYTGCNSDAECVASIAEGYVCDATAPFFPTCTLSCVTAADCAVPGAGSLFDENHYTCESQLCRWQGCTTDTECSEALFGDYVCYTDPAFGVPTCLPACSTAADCSQDLLAYDADNYTCEEGVCLYAGCNTNEECADLLGADAVCL